MRCCGRRLSCLALLALAVTATPAAAQNPAAQQQATQAEHARMMALLGIEALRPGANADPAAPNPANTDEAKATLYPDLPDPLTMQDGRAVTDAAMWRQERRPELLALFDRDIYGAMPADVPGVAWEIVDEAPGMAGDVPVAITRLAGRADNAAAPEIEVVIDLIIVAPDVTSESAANVPVIVEFSFGGFPGQAPPPFPPAHAVQILERGWAYAALVPTSVQADNGAGLNAGIIGLANRGAPRAPEDWGALRAWAWGASRALDVFEADPRIDAGRAAIAGLSRYGKAAIVAMAYEERWAAGFIGSSGAGGLKLLRRDFGERVENLAAAGQHHWMAGNFLNYAGPLEWGDMPVDAHQLLALAAPRPVFISAGAPAVEGEWIDQRGMFLAGVHAGPVYELLGAHGLGTDAYPPVGALIAEGDIAFRVHEGGHTLGPNWPFMLDFAARYFQRGGQ